MMGEQVKRFSIGLALAVFISAGPAFAQDAGLRRCTKTVEVTSNPSGVGNSISTKPAIVCSVQLLATGANAWGQVYDSPSPTSPTHAQSRNVSEPGAATSGNSSAHFFGDQGFLTHFGLGAMVHNGRLIIHYDD